MTVQEIIDELKIYGNPAIKKVFLNHGAHEPLFGVKVGDLKKIQKKIKKNYQLSLDLYATGNSDAMYLAGLIADEKQMTRADLQKWVKGAYWYMISEYTVPWIAAESDFGYELALEWIDSPEENIAAAGWSTLSSLATIKADKDLNIPQFEQLMERAAGEIHQSANRVRYTMNGFIIAVGCCVVPLSDKAMKLSDSIGKVQVDMGGTACKVPFGPEYIKKVKAKGRLGKKKKMARC